MFVWICAGASCKEKADNTSVQFDVSSNELVFWPEASSKTVHVSGNVDFSASLSDYLDQSWCTVEIIPNKVDNLKVSVTDNEQIRQERNTRIVVGAEGADNKFITVRQTGAEPALFVKETQIVVNENDRLTFSLEITSNIPVSFGLPEWITLASGNPQTTGRQTCLFEVVPLVGAESERAGSITVRAQDHAAFDNSVTVPVRQNRATCALRVASYNVLIRDWTADRIAMVNNLIRSYDFDVFGIQEASKKHIDDILAAGGYSYIGVGRDDGISGGEHSAILYKSNKFEVLDNGDFWYSETPGIPSVGWGASYRRICSWGKFRELTSGREFYFFCSHYDHQVATARLESAKLMVAKIRQIAGAYPVFAVGDYNCTVIDAPIAYILNEGLLKDSRTQTETPPVGTKGTYSAMSYTLPQMNEHNPIDIIFVISAIRVKSYSVINDRPNGQYPSDHDPVMIDVEF
ncbi:MAG: endonuclease/exonuclease/phosphatase family protein [Bacteroidales bacterium]|nr:endonuclease/exonuclease/phosphatase family protein [Bacteroidales bacterium]